jgi:putative SOS response-associated peptidase YedK
VEARRGPQGAQAAVPAPLKDSGIFAFAGLWTVAQPKDATEKIASCAIITTSANRDVNLVHDRMPVVLDGPAADAAWLDPDVDLDAALEFVRPLPDGLLESIPVDEDQLQPGRGSSC